MSWSYSAGGEGVQRAGQHKGPSWKVGTIKCETVFYAAAVDANDDDGDDVVDDDDDDGADVDQDTFAALPLAQRWRANHSPASVSGRRPRSQRYGQLLSVCDYCQNDDIMMMIMVSSFYLLRKTLLLVELSVITHILLLTLLVKFLD